MFDFSLCALLVRSVWELRLFAMPDNQSRCEGRVTAIKAVAQDISTGKDALCATAILSRDSRHGSIATDCTDLTRPMMSAVPPVATEFLRRDGLSRRANSGLMHRNEVAEPSETSRPPERARGGTDSAPRPLRRCALRDWSFTTSRFASD